MGRRGRRARRRANKAALHAAAVAAGIPAHAAAASINNPNLKWDQTFSQMSNQIANKQVDNQRAAADRERQQLQVQMQERQTELLQAVRDSQPVIPRANRPLKSASYSPSFSIRKKTKKEAEKAALGAYQFASPLSMGIGLGSGSTTGIGLG